MEVDKDQDGELVVLRSDPYLINNNEYSEILIKEPHDHPIVYNQEHSQVRWKANPDVVSYVEVMGLNEIVVLFQLMGYDKNSEPYRKLYRDIGYSLQGYWEVFYWESNNPEAANYVYEGM